ncbi:MAG: hypothetical protein PVS2B2_06670 [Candidatus Acidiferrum sp.]
MHSLTSVPLPTHDEKTDAVLLYSEDVTTVQSNGKIKNLRRRAYKILRPEGKWYGKVRAYFDSETRIASMHAWCIPAQGKDYEVKEKDALETAPFDIENGALATDFRVKVLDIPASEPGNIVGYEIEQEVRPYVFESTWEVQRIVPVREARFVLQLPAGWEYRAVWVNHPDVAPTSAGNNQYQWVVNDVKAIKREEEMPPWEGVAARMAVALIPANPGSRTKGFENWREMGLWYGELTRGRRDPSPEIRQKVAELTTSRKTQLAKMSALASFMQRDIRYVGIWLGIGGWQPHAATEVYAHRYGDCKDKATLLSSMLNEIGIESYYVLINTERGVITGEMPPQKYFNHAILAIQLPKGTKDESLVAVKQHPKLGPLLFFDPTDLITPFGQLRGPLQANYGLLVAPEGGELLELPQLPAAMNAIRRTGKFTLTPSGMLAGDVTESRVGDRAAEQRRGLTSVSKDSDKIKPIETLLANSLSSFRITKASVTNLAETDQPFGFDYSLVANSYAKEAGNLILVRPRVIGAKGSGVLETKEPRQYPLEFRGPARDTDAFEITLPAGYEVDDLPPPVDADYSFASYHSKTEASGNVLRYSRTFEIKELSVPMSKMDDLKKFYRIIAGDERNVAVFKPTAK